MRKIFLFILLVTTLPGCKSKKVDVDGEVKFNKELAEELADMAETDQIAAYIPEGKYKEWSKQKWNTFKDSVFTSHQNRISEIFEEYGYPGFNRVGKEGSENFWLMVQHSNHNPDFQKKVLEKMRIAVDQNNATPSNYGLLVDRVNVNAGKAQVYGTQVSYNTGLCYAYADNLEDSINVDKRRASMGFRPLAVYLNIMTKAHFEMNKDFYLEQGIKEPKLYKIQ